MLLIIWLEDRIGDDTQRQWTVVIVMVVTIEGMYERRQFFAILEISASVIGICILVCYSVACVKGFLMCDVRMIVCRLFAMSK